MMPYPFKTGTEQSRAVQDNNNTMGGFIDLPPAIAGGLESSVTSLTPSEETKVAEEPTGARIPDGGFRAWLVVVGGFLDFAIAFGELAVPPPLLPLFQLPT